MDVFLNFEIPISRTPTNDDQVTHMTMKVHYSINHPLQAPVSLTKIVHELKLAACEAGQKE
jgi:hypothetical protein